ncbi:MAG: ABC transporter permease [Chitinophagales bacterium]|jgi:hypothetical protein|nr:ABC transporter permease [Sphingobacteriales bacterium]
MIQINILKAEILKNKSFVSLKVLLLFPLLVVLLISSSYFIRDAKNFPNDVWLPFFIDLVDTWSLMFLPINCILLVYSVFGVENYTNNWKNMFSMGIRRTTILNNKFTLLLIYNLLSNVVLIFYGIFVMLLLKVTRPEFKVLINFTNPNLFIMVLLIFLGSLGIIIIYSLVTIWVQSIIYPLVLFVFMTMVNLFIALKNVSIYYPISYPSNIIYNFTNKENYLDFIIISIAIFGLGIFAINCLVDKKFNKKKL